MPTSASGRPDDTQTPSKSQGIPCCVPVFLLALTTAVLVVPVVLLRRHNSTVRSKALKDAPRCSWSWAAHWCRCGVSHGMAAL
ncbi:hypothetical protein PsYK624_158570 [Phanerochaete sordida]|uniref:Uncharacterized protein n=1 Tax=Phanerochaete sordida TaxID=48140 RepID=A0A9P3GQ04_9APHY|nr:hypothetical protein PsYK624_158570 [Phanerochaete sordida]